MNFEEKTVSSEEIYDGKIIKVRKEKVELPDGRLATRELIGHPGGVGIIAVDGDGKVFMVTQYRIAAKSEMLEIPAGKMEYGEDPLECGARELIEETGYKAEEFTHLGEYYATPGYCEEKLNMLKQMLVNTAKEVKDVVVDNKKDDKDITDELINEDDENLNK